MKILIFTYECNYDTRQELWINGKRKRGIRSLSECPEDAKIGRSLIDADDLLSMIELGHKAAVDGEKLEIENIAEDPDEIYENEQWNDLVARGFVS